MKKLKIKQLVDLCRRRVAYYEWKQTMLQMTMGDFHIFLKRIDKCSVCIEKIIITFDAHDRVMQFKWRWRDKKNKKCIYFFQITKDVKLWLNDKMEAKTIKLNQKSKNTDDVKDVSHSTSAL